MAKKKLTQKDKKARGPRAQAARVASKPATVPVTPRATTQLGITAAKPKNLSSTPAATRSSRLNVPTPTAPDRAYGISRVSEQGAPKA